MVELICKHSKAYVVESVTPSDNDGENGFDKFVFALKQKGGCSFNAIVGKDSDGDTGLNIDEKTKCAPPKNETQDESFYGVKWDGSEIDKLNSLGYSPKAVSKHMYEANDSCSKYVKSISKDKQMICIKYKCGFTTWSYVIDTYREKGKAQSSGWCFWTD